MKKLLDILLKVQVGLVFLMPLPSFGQESANLWNNMTEEVLFWALLMVEGLLLLVTFTLFFVIKVVAHKVLQPASAQQTQVQEATETVEAPAESFFKRLMRKMNDSVPVERETEVMTNHTYDGIYELDNNLPPWWKAMFYATIVFSVIYLVHYHILDTGDLQDQEYEKEMADAKTEIEAYLATSANNVDESNVTMVEEPARLESAKQLYVEKCAACHGQAGEGGVGPNLTDAYWLHGGDIKDIFKTIKNGVPEKGMIPWKAQLSPVQIQDISSYIISLEGSNPPNAKEPQGDLYERKEPVASLTK